VVTVGKCIYVCLRDRVGPACRVLLLLPGGSEEGKLQASGVEGRRAEVREGLRLKGRHGEVS
jgi:hypothetical protein